MLDESGGPWERQPEGLVQLAPWLPIPQILWFAPLWRDIVGGLAPTVTGTVARAVSRGGVGASFQSGGILDFGDRFNETSFTNLLVFEVPTLASTALLQQDYDNGGGESAGSQYIDVTAAGDLRLVRDSQAVIVETTAGGFIQAKREHWAVVSWNQNTGSGFICIDGQVRASASPGTSGWITTGRYVLGRRRPSDLSATSDHIQYLHARWARPFSEAEARRLTGGRYAELFAPRVEDVFDPPGGAATPVGRADETDTAIALAGLQIRAAGRADETDAALALAAVQISATGRADEADSALALTPLQVTATGRADETDASLPLGSARLAGLAAETDSALALAAVQVAATGLAAETDTALALAPVQATATGLAAEADAALPLAAVQLRAVGRSDEIDTALALVAPGGVGVAEEVDSALALAASQIRAVGLAAEEDAALALAPGAASAVGQADELDVALTLAGVQILAVGMATESDAALALVPLQLLTVGLSLEIDTSFALAAIQKRAVGRVDELDQACVPGVGFDLPHVISPRLFLVDPQDRAYLIDPEDRTYIVPASSRSTTA